MRNEECVYIHKFMHRWNISKVVEDSNTINKADLINIYNRTTIIQSIIVSSTFAIVTHNYLESQKGLNKC